jgi:hypothetical protein
MEQMELQNQHQMEEVAERQFKQSSMSNYKNSLII